MRYYYHSGSPDSCRAISRNKAVGRDGVQALCAYLHHIGFGAIYEVCPVGGEFALSDYEVDDYRNGRFTAECNHCGELAYVDSHTVETVEQCGKCHKYDMDHYDDGLTDVEADSMTLASAGYGTDEDYE
ncbi:uncharacterized protein METZ01_LOCUS376015 [marine metagenome]|jgi:ribosomal protein S27AE|uniref:Uncharacterized protein n=1 Tax=marine metagenome TaxID=408172 RepID=A0A382TNU6_9ZZZZ|tara:strand:- start:634 stop:1020 length:387 start_codon:yes stop_codon:yes gene_type:complete